jgi:hypothetical protein
MKEKESNDFNIISYNSNIPFKGLAFRRKRCSSIILKSKRKFKNANKNKSTRFLIYLFIS